MIADRSSGVIRRATVSLRGTLAVIGSVLALPILMGLGARWSARAEISHLRTGNALLQLENGSYRTATGDLATQIQSLESVINDLGTRAALDPEQVRAMQKLPVVVRTRAVGGTALPNATVSQVARTPITSPDDLFGALRELLQ